MATAVSFKAAVAQRVSTAAPKRATVVKAPVNVEASASRREALRFAALAGTALFAGKASAVQDYQIIDDRDAKKKGFDLIYEVNQCGYYLERDERFMHEDRSCEGAQSVILNVSEKRVVKTNVCDWCARRPADNPGDLPMHTCGQNAGESVKNSSACFGWWDVQAPARPELARCFLVFLRIITTHHACANHCNFVTMLMICLNQARVVTVLVAHLLSIEHPHNLKTKRKGKACLAFHVPEHARTCSVT